MPDIPPEASAFAAECWRLYAPYVQKLCAYKLASDPAAAEDVLSETFLALLNALAHGETVRDPKAWLTVTANNLIKKAYQNRRKRAERFVPEREAALFTLPVPEETGAELTAEELLGAMDGFLASLTPAERELFEQRFVHEKKLKTIAAETGVSVNTVKQRVFRLKQKGAAYAKQWAQKKV